MTTTPATKWDGIVVNYTNAAGTPAKVGRIKKVPAPTYTAEDIDVTDQDSGGIKEYISGMKDGSEIEIVCNDIPTDAGQINLLADEGKVGSFQFVFPNGRSLTFGASIKTCNIVEDGKAMALSIKAKVSGAVSRGLDEVKLTALAVSTGTLFPAFDDDVREYQLPEINGTATITVTPTSAGNTITVNGTGVTSGAASGNI
jgi:predicted secreted protein